MPHPRRLPRIPATGRVTLQFRPEQRDLFIPARETPANLSHALHRAPVRAGKLTVRVTRPELDALIQAAANHPTADARAERAVGTLLRYLETAESRFDEPADPPPAESSSESGP